MPSNFTVLAKKELSTAASNRLFAFAIKIAYEAGAILKSGYNKPRAITHKGVIDLVTDTDIKSEKHICRRIQATYPDHAILAEEGGGGGAGKKNTTSPFRWVIDPLDGTTNFAHGYPAFCVSIALEHNSKTIIGVVFDPLRDEMFSAALSGGAKLNRKKLSVTKVRKLEKALCATGFPYNMHTSKQDNLKNFKTVAKRVQGIRRGGSAALDLCYVAAGRFEAYWELKLAPWDSAAGALIAREAGAKVTDITGAPHNIQQERIIAANPILHKQLLKLIN